MRKLVWLASLVASASYAFKLEPLAPVHESLTLASLRCANSQGNVSPDAIECLPAHLNFMRTRAAFRKLDDADFTSLFEGVLWADAPDRRSLPDKLEKFTVCDRHVKSTVYGPYTNKMCASHFGNLQMLHAMKPARPWCAQHPEEPTCKLADDELFPQFVRWLAQLALIETSPQTPLTQVGGERFFVTELGGTEQTLFSVFGVDCGRAHAPGKCFMVADTFDAARLSRIATGVLLHIIQDSFSRAHAAREGDTVEGTPDDCNVARISCGPILQWNDYGAQSSGKHSQADAPPLWAPNCLPPRRAGTVVDPITAGARVLRFVERNKGKTDQVEALMKLVLSVVTLPTGGAAPDAACFAK